VDPGALGAISIIHQSGVITRAAAVAGEEDVVANETREREREREREPAGSLARRVFADALFRVDNESAGDPRARYYLLLITRPVNY